MTFMRLFVGVLQRLVFVKKLGCFYVRMLVSLFTLLFVLGQSYMRFHIYLHNGGLDANVLLENLIFCFLKNTKVETLLKALMQYSGSQAFFACEPPFNVCKHSLRPSQINVSRYFK